MAPSVHFGFRPFAQEFELSADVHVARTVARANPQHGPGGGEKLFIPFNEQARALMPVGDLIYLDEHDEEQTPQPAGFVAEMIRIEAALGNALVRADCKGSRNSLRFWMQDPLHIAELERTIRSFPAACRFEDLDPHGNTAGFVDADQQTLISPFKQPQVRSWISKLFRR